ncbi:MAG: cysteine--tRNA ligase [bacterium]
MNQGPGLRLYNTLTGQKEEFIPLDPRLVKIYVCGITPYDHCHLGHARCYLTFDLLRRYIEHLGYNLLYVQNLTDVDDKIIERANEMGVPIQELTRKYIKEYFRVMEALNIKPASIYPRATEHIPEMKEGISRLIEKGYAYQAGGDVFFEVSKLDGYGCLSGRNPEEINSLGARLELNPEKRNQADFTLWKKSKEGEPKWDSPWGAGRPGWHTECVVMSTKYLGEEFDIHGGGADLIFPHHENEIAQVRGLTGKSLARYWLHNGFLTYEEEKMSKSLGNVVLLKDLLETYSADILRLFFFNAHYRSPLSFTLDKLDQAAKALDRLRGALTNISHCLSETAGDTSEAAVPALSFDELSKEESEFYQQTEKSQQDFESALADDLHTPKALSVIFDLVAAVNQFLVLPMTPLRKRLLKKARDKIEEAKGVLGLSRGEKDYQKEVLGQDLLPLLIHLREKARQRRDWAEADWIREELGKLGIILEDLPGGTRWKNR